MKREGHLFERAVSFDSLCAAARRAACGKRLSLAAARFLLELEREVLALQRELLDGSYRLRPYRTFAISDPKPRTISAAHFRDRVVHHSVCAALDPLFERCAHFDSYACRKGKGTLRCLQRAQHWARRFAFFLKLDIRKHFESMDHAVLRGLLRRKLKDRRLLALLDHIIEAGAPGSPPGKGLPIGNLTSQHFANFFLGLADGFIKQQLRIRGYCRYMDDFLLFSDSKAALWAALADLEAYLAETLLLELRRPVLLSPVLEGVPFLGFRVFPGCIRLDGARKRRLVRKLRVQHRQRAALGEDVVARSAQSLVGWAEHGDTRGFRRALLTAMLAEETQTACGSRVRGSSGREPRATGR